MMKLVNVLNKACSITDQVGKDMGLYQLAVSSEEEMNAALAAIKDHLGNMEAFRLVLSCFDLFILFIVNLWV